MSAPAFPCQSRGLALPERAPCHTSRDIRYIFLESCRNIPASHHHHHHHHHHQQQHPLDGAGASSIPPGPASRHSRAQPYLSTGERCHPSLCQHLPAFLAFSTHLGMAAMDGGGSPEAKKRLPVFRQLCGEPVEELQEFPGAQEAPGGAKGWRIPLASACPTCNEA